MLYLNMKKRRNNFCCNSFCKHLNIGNSLSNQTKDKMILNNYSKDQGYPVRFKSCINSIITS